MANKRLEEANTISFVWFNGYDRWKEEAPKGIQDRYKQLLNEAEKYRDLSQKIIEDYRIRTLSEFEEKTIKEER